MRISVLETDLAAVYGEPLLFDDDAIETLAACPVCGAGDGQAVLGQAEAAEAAGLVVAQCQACNHIYLQHRPSGAWYQRYYAEDWDSGRHGFAADGPVTSLKRALRRNRAVYETLRRIKFLGRPDRLRDHAAALAQMFAGLAGPDGGPLRPGSRILEIGSGYGGALLALRSLGFAVCGTEASRYRVEVCRSQGLDVVQTPIDDLSAAAAHGPFDAVYSTHVFEHLLDLQAMMANLAPLLRDGGLLYIEVPNGPVAENIVHRLHVPVHCHMFDERSLATLMRRHGYGPVRAHQDVNLHMIARKGADDVLPRPGRTAVSGLLRGLPVLARHEDAGRFQYDAINTVIEPVAGGARWYEHPCPYGTPWDRRADGTIVNRFVLRAERGDTAPDEPVRLIHPGSRPPAWLKRQ